MENKVDIPDMTKAYSPRKGVKITRSMYNDILRRLDALEALVSGKSEDKPKRTRRTKAEIEAAKKEIDNA